MDPHFYPPYVNSAFYVTSRLRRRRSANRTQPNFAKRRMVNRANNLLQNSWDRPPRKKWGPINFNICSVFRWLWHLMANICWTKRDIDNRARALKSTKGLLHCPKIWWTLVYKRLQTGPDFSPPSPFCSTPVHQTPSNPLIGINVAPPATLNETALDLSAVASGGLKWQYIAIIATFSSLCSVILTICGLWGTTRAISVIAELLVCVLLYLQVTIVSSLTWTQQLLSMLAALNRSVDLTAAACWLSLANYQ